MPGRQVPLVTDQLYHVFNRTLDSREIFAQLPLLRRAKTILNYYRYTNPPFKLSLFLIKSAEEQNRIIKYLNKENNKLVNIYCYAFMPNHFHFLLRQKIDHGISKFLSQIQNSFTRYFNTKNKRSGSIFYDQFKAKRIVNEEYLLHLSRYIHLNPYTAFLLKNKSLLDNYPWTSLPEYIGTTSENLCDREEILGIFAKRDKFKKYKEFIYNQADYQRQLGEIKHLTLE